MDSLWRMGPGADRLKQCFFGAAALSLLGLWMATGGYRAPAPLAGAYSPVAVGLGAAMAAFFGLGAVYFLIQALPGACGIEADSQGLTVRSLFRVRHHAWTEISDFQVDPAGRHVVARLGARSERLPDPRLLGRSAEELAERLRHLRARMVPGRAGDRAPG